MLKKVSLIASVAVCAVAMMATTMEPAAANDRNTRIEGLSEHAEARKERRAAKKEARAAKRAERRAERRDTRRNRDKTRDKMPFDEQPRHPVSIPRMPEGAPPAVGLPVPPERLPERGITDFISIGQ